MTESYSLSVVWLQVTQYSGLSAVSPVSLVDLTPPDSPSTPRYGVEIFLQIYFNSIVYIQTSSLLHINLQPPLIDRINSTGVKCYLWAGEKCWKWTITQLSVWLMGQAGPNLSLNFTIVTLLFLLSLFCFYCSDSIFRFMKKSEWHQIWENVKKLNACPLTAGQNWVGKCQIFYIF